MTISATQIQTRIIERRPGIELANVAIARDGISILESTTALIPPERITAVIGPNGAGKTSLVHAILGLLAFQGKICFRAENGVERGRPRIGYVPQRLDFDRGTPITVLDFLSMAHQRRPLWLGTSQRSKDQAALYLKRVRSEHLLFRPPWQTLGRRTAARPTGSRPAARSGDPHPDEPVSGVDVVGEKLFCELLDVIQHESR